MVFFFFHVFVFFFFFFFFQAEDGIRDHCVTGVQTCALPISPGKRIPPQLFSHSDQVSFWQTGAPVYNLTSGWAGRIADRMAAAGANGSSGVGLCMSLAGNNRLQTGGVTIPYPLTTGGAVAYANLRDPITTPQGRALDTILKLSRSNLMEQEYLNVTGRARDAFAQV